MRSTKLISLLLALLISNISTFVRANDLAENVPPQFAAIGQSFWMSTGCSPHSANVRLAVHADSLMATQAQPYGIAKTISLNYANLDLTVLVNENRPGPTPPVAPTPVVLHAQEESEKVAYQEALADLNRMVTTLKNGNVCFKAQPILDEIVVYLNGLAGL